MTEPDDEVDYITIEDIANAAEAAFGGAEVEGFAATGRAGYAQMGMNFLGNLAALGKPINIPVLGGVGSGQGRQPTFNFR